MSGFTALWRTHIYNFCKKYKIGLFLFLPLVVIAVAFFFYYKPSKVLVNGSRDIKRGGVVVKTADDRENGGSSVASKPYEKSFSYAFSYTLKEGFPYPYSAISFSRNDAFFDFSGYDYCSITLKATKGKRLPLIFYSIADGFTVPGDFNTFRNSQYVLNVSQQFKTVFVPLSEFDTPQWWYTQNKVREEQFSKPDFAKVKYLTLSNCLEIPKGEKDIVQVAEISFHVSLWPFFIWAAAGYCIYGVIGFVVFKSSGKKSPELNFQYKKVETVNRMEKEEELVFQYITSNYYKPELTISEVQNATGISEYRLSSIIKSKAGLSFKQFLNKLRVTEAKRLLTETDLQVSEVAFKAGYGNVSHFNRVFKDQEGCSPNAYRKQTCDLAKS